MSAAATPEKSATTSSATANQAAPPPAAVTTDADTRTAGGVAALGLVQQARLSRLNRDAAAAVATYGQGSSQAAAAQAAVAAALTAGSRLAIQHQQFTTPPPKVAAAGWALHGRVYDSNLNPLASYTVFLVDSQNNYLSDYGFSYTDATGYFLISYDGVKKADVTQSAQAQPAGTAQTTTIAPAGQQTATAPSSGAAAATPQSATTAQAPAAAPVGQAGTEPGSTTAGAAPQRATTNSAAGAALSSAYLQVADDKANPKFLSKTAFTPSTGQAIYQVITIGADTAPLGDPPPAVRAEALPPPRKRDS
jgi:hypothetical protein